MPSNPRPLSRVSKFPGLPAPPPPTTKQQPSQANPTLAQLERSLEVIEDHKILLEIANICLDSVTSRFYESAHDNTYIDRVYTQLKEQLSKLEMLLAMRQLDIRDRYKL